MILGIDASRAATAQRTGTEAYAYHLIRALIPLAERKGHRLRLYFNAPPAPGLLPAADWVELAIMPWSRLWTHLRLGWELYRRPPDLFFTPAHVIPLTYRGLAAATVHDLGYHYFPEAHTRSQLVYLKWSTRHNGRISRCLFADSQATLKDLARWYGVDPARIVVVYPGLDPDLRRVTDGGEITAVLRKYGITPPYLLFLSTLQPRKNLARLVQAYAASDVPHQLVLAGKQGWRARPILEAIARLPSPISDRIILPGFIANTDKAGLISGATALLYPSLYEGFGFPVLEGQACGTAVLAANTSSLPEIAGKGALFVDPLETAVMTEAIRALVRDPLLRYELVQAGFANVKRFTWEAAAEQVMRTLETAVSAPA